MPRTNTTAGRTTARAAPTVTLRTAPQLGALVRERRRELALSQAELARRLGVSQSRVSVLESHPDRLTVEQLLSLASALQLTLHLGIAPSAQARGAAAW
jgi:HTH-type transcriptional regulator / antitoxin HipB